MGEEEIENFPLREIKSSLKKYFRYILICKFIWPVRLEILNTT